MATTPKVFAAKMTTLAAGMPKTAEAGVGASCLLVKKSVLAVAPDRMRNVGKKGVRLAVRYRFLQTGPRAVAAIRAVPPGPWSMIEYGTRPHDIPKQGRRRKSTGKRLKFPDGEFRTGPVKHPGSRGRGPWAKGVAAALPMCPAVFDKAVKAEMAALFGG